MVLIGKRHWLRHDARPATAGQKLLALVGLTLSVAGILALAVAPILRGDSGTTALVVGLLATAVGLGMYWMAGNMVKPAHSGSMAAHFIVRALTLVVLLIGVNILLKRYDRWRYDATQGQVSSLSPDTKKLLREIAKNQKRPVNIEAFISTPVPEEYVETRYSLVSTLKELERQSGGKVRVTLHQNIELFSDEAAQADQRFGIQRQRINTQARGALKEEEFIMGVAFTCGLEKVVLPSFKLGMPVEYELIRSVATVAGDQRKRLGVVNTEAQMMGGFSMAGMQPRQIPKQLILDELEKQYKVDQVDPANPIDLGRYDVLLIVQPSSLGPPQLANVVEAIKQGQPAVVFEDPHPIVMPQTVGTAAPNPSQGGMFGMGGQSAPKGDIRALWNALEIQVTGDEGELRQPPDEVVWQKYNPYPRFAGRLEPELVFIRDDMPDTKEPFNREVPAVSHFEEVLFPTPTGVTQKLGAKLKMTDLVSTSDDRAGTIEAMKFQTTDPSQLDRERGNPTKRSYTLAAWIRGEPSTPEKPATSGGGAEGEGQSAAVPPAKADAKEAKKDAKPGDSKAADGKATETAKAEEKKREINVIYVGDIDCLSSEFVRMRNEPNNLMAKFRFDNVPFVLNLIDAVAGEDRYFEIRKRKPKHSTLRMIEIKAANARAAEQDKILEARKQFTQEEQNAEADAHKVYADLKKLVQDLQDKNARGVEIDRAELEAKLAQLRIQESYINRQLAVTKQRLERARDAELAKVERERDQEIQRIQNDYKIQATVLPPILPLLAGVIVWAYRRIREREGVSRTRMRS
jgi:ABC-2 type transport system permease protein